ncbi:U3 snoRNP protein [Teratosphaeriaceae sp. CCFEE 6253]|nr:U3 snoRNP protein [Teratosphaeriaceae sp. CCFEE 6253]
MAAAGPKRRKLEHASSGEEDDASFASFGASEDEARELGGGGVLADAGGEPNSHEDEDEDEDEDEESLGDVAEDEVDEEVEIDEDVAESLSEVRDQDDELDGAEAAQTHAPDQTDRRQQRQSNARPGGVKPRATAPDTNGGAYMAGTSKSNLFKLQVDELLEQIRPRRGKREGGAEQALHDIKKTLDEAPLRGPLSVEDAERRLFASSKVVIPFPDPRPPVDSKYKLEFAKPSSVNVIGSYALKTSSRARGFVEIDMVVTMPASLFQEKDYLNHRYFYKRAYYLACLAASLRDYDVHFTNFHGDRLKPVIWVTPKPPSGTRDTVKSTPKWRINIIPSVGADVLPKDRLSPSKNCIRPAGEAKPEPTPFYNSSLRADMLVSSYLHLLHNAASTCDGFRDACLLGSTWLRQRGFTTSGFGAFEWSALMALLLLGGGPNGKPLLSEGYSSYQLFKATLQLLARRDLSKSALVIGDGDVKPVGDGSPMLWDTTRAHNVLYRVTPGVCSSLKQDARTSLSMLSDQHFDGFDAAFIMRTDGMLLKHDYLIILPASALSGVDDEPERLRVVLKRGLGDRVSSVSIYSPSSSSWLPGSARGKAISNTPINIGLSVNPDTVSRTVDHGPAAESKAEAAAFRQFWGEKAELRRFKDGSITESLVWGTSEGGKTVLEQIARFLLLRHFGEDVEKQASFVDQSLSHLLQQGASMTPFRPLMEAYKQLETDIRGLEGMPLSVRHVMPADSQLRFSSIHPPAHAARKHRPKPADVTIQFEGSTRWPDNIAAIQRTKIAFLLKLAELILAGLSAATARVGLENPEDEMLNQAYLDIAYDSGAAFRMRIHHDREETLLERQLKDKSVPPSSREAAARGLAAYKRDYIKVPAHTEAIARLCSRYPPLSGTIRLLKLWFASHLLANHVADEVVELIAVRTIVQPWPWETPSSEQTGFLRTLHWLSRWDWHAEPLVVDLSGSGELSVADAQDMRTSFEAWRKVDPSLNRIVLFVASSLDHGGTTWTDGRPQRVVAGRITALAKSACAEVDEKQGSLKPAELFSSALSDYDFVLHLDPHAVSGSKKWAGDAFKNIELDGWNDESMIGFDAAQLLLEELESLYGSAILFLSGGHRRPVIAGLWSPQTAARAWKMNLAYSTKPKTVRGKEGEEEGVRAEINKEGILAEIARIGGSLVQRVQVRST